MSDETAARVHAIARAVARLLERHEVPSRFAAARLYSFMPGLSRRAIWASNWPTLICRRGFGRGAWCDRKPGEHVQKTVA
jgi:hypothetical protein